MKQNVNNVAAVLLAKVARCKFCSNGTPILKSAVHSF